MSEAAAGSSASFVPVRRSPLEASHAALGARWVSPTSRWPVDYGDRSGETALLRTGAALIDWGPLDKITIKGARIGDALAAIGLAFRPGEVSAPAPGGGAARGWGLAPDEALVLAPGGSVGLARRLEDGGGSVLDVSSGFAAFRLVGLRARAVLERLCPVDLRADALGVGRVTFGPVANVRVTLGREDLADGTPGFTLLVARDQAAYLWDSLLTEGADEGLRPAGQAVLDPAPGSGGR